MHLAVETRLVHDLGTVGLQCAPIVVEAYSGHTAAQPVRDPRGQSPEGAVLPVEAPAADDVVAFVELVEQGGDVLGVVLKVTVHRDDDIALCVVEACCHCGRLAEVPSEANELKPTVRCGQTCEASVRL